MTWDPIAQPDDYAQIDGAKAPGVCVLTKFVKKRKLLKVDPYGSRGARVISLGEYLAEWSFTVTLATADEWQAWPAFEKAIDRIPVGPRGKAASVVWAPITSRNVREIMIEAVEGPLPSDDTGAWQVTISGCAWVPIPKLALSAPKEAEKPAPSKDPVDQTIAKLAEQVASRINRR